MDKNMIFGVPLTPDLILKAIALGASLLMLLGNMNANTEKLQTEIQNMDKRVVRIENLIDADRRGH